jgi:tRNA nucleotidyltransferase (CCA-adding enzyme)
VLQACTCDARGRLGLENLPYPQAQRLMLALQLAQSVATHLIAEQAIAQGANGQNIGKTIHQARVQAIAGGL